MTETMTAVLASALVSSFVICCLVSAALQILAWWRHAREGVPVSIKALWKPEGYFDEVGIHQIRLARRLLNFGGWAYLGYVALFLVGGR